MGHLDRFSVAVVGAGVAGLGVAWRLAQAGCAVTLFDVATIPAQSGAATWASGGMLCARLEMTGAPAPLAAKRDMKRASFDETAGHGGAAVELLSLIHISEPTRPY